MNTPTIIIAFFLTPFMLLGQSESTVSFSVSPTHSYFVIQSEGRPSGTIFQLATERDDKPGLGWCFGVNGSQKITKDDYLEFGFHLVTVNFSTKSSFFSSRDFESNKFILLEFPLLIRHVFETNNFTSYMVAGFTFGSYQSSSTSATNLKEPFVENLPSFNISAVLGAGLEYKFSDDRALFFQPTFRYDIRGIQVGFIDKYHFYTLGMDIGVRKYL